MSIGSRFLVATAGHNLTEHADDQIALVHRDGEDHLQVSFVNRWPRQGDSIPDPDLGFIEVSPEVAALSSREFVPLGELNSGVPRAGVSATLVGYPASRTVRRQLAENLVHIRAMGFHATVDTLGADDFSLLLRGQGFRIDDSRPMDTPDLRGVSGGGAWSIPGLRQSGLWSAQGAKLLGIQFAFQSQERRALVASARSWLRLVAVHYPDLADSISSHLNEAPVTR